LTKKIEKEKVIETESDKKSDVPVIYALIPILPIILLIVFQNYLTYFLHPSH